MVHAIFNDRDSRGFFAYPMPPMLTCFPTCLQSQAAIGEKESAAGADAAALDQAQAQQQPLQEKIRKETHSYDHQKEVSNEAAR